MGSAWEFIRRHFGAGVIIALLVGALVFKTVSETAPVVERTRFDGTIVAITHTGDNWNGRPPKFGYKIAPLDGGESISLTNPHLHRIGSRVTVERIVRSSGYMTYQIATVPHQP